MKLNPDKGKSPEQLAWERGYAQGLANAKALQAPQAQAVPAVGSPEASALIDSELAAYGWPANPKNAARVGYEACRKLAGLGIGATTGEQHG